MILLLAVLLSISIAVLRGGKLTQLVNVPLRYGWVALIALIIQLFAVEFMQRRRIGQPSQQALLVLGSYVLLLAVVVFNRHLAGMWLIGVGLALNLLVMLANGGFMPVTLEALQRAGMAHLAVGTEAGSRVLSTKDVLLPRELTRLWLLSDILVIPRPLPFTSVFSIGDCWLAGGAFIFLQKLTQPSARKSIVAANS